MDALCWATSQTRLDPPVSDSDVLPGRRASRVLQVAPRRRIRIVIETAAHSEGDTLAFGDEQVAGD